MGAEIENSACKKQKLFWVLGFMWRCSARLWQGVGVYLEQRCGCIFAVADVWKWQGSYIMQPWGELQNKARCCEDVIHGRG